jgi:sporulation protein YlmC with PRC-barrel domain
MLFLPPMLDASVIDQRARCHRMRSFRPCRPSRAPPILLSQHTTQRMPDVMRFTLLCTIAGGLFLGLVAPILAAPGPTDAPPQGLKKPVLADAGKTCLAAVRAFNVKMQADGYWLGGSSYGYGYPMGGIGYGYGDGYGYGASAGADVPPGATGFRDARPGYEVRVLLASATILAKNGQPQSCETVLTTVRTIYSAYVADAHASGLRTADGPAWQQQQVATATAVTGTATPFRTDQLIDTDVRSAQNEPLGSVHDLVMSPKTGQIAYVIVGRGGLFGIDESFVPVPWADFKIAANANLLVLDTTKAVMTTAPEVTSRQFTTHGQFDKDSRKVDAYWAAKLPVKAAAK